MGAKFIMQYIAKVSGGGPNVQVRGEFRYQILMAIVSITCYLELTFMQTGFANF